MKIVDDKIEVETRPADAIHGAKPEPEERPATRVITTDGAKVGWGQGVSPEGVDSSSLPPGASPTMKSSITSTQTVAEFTAKATMCSTCKHFDNAAWLKVFAKWRQSKDKFEIAELEQVRAQLANAKGKFALTGGGDVDASVSVYGLCTAYTKLFKDMQLEPSVTWVHPMCVCPGTHRARPDVPLPKLYKERKAGMFTALKDRILGIASRKSGR